MAVMAARAVMAATAWAIGSAALGSAWDWEACSASAMAVMGSAAMADTAAMVATAVMVATAATVATASGYGGYGGYGYYPYMYGSSLYDWGYSNYYNPYNYGGYGLSAYGYPAPRQLWCSHRPMIIRSPSTRRPRHRSGCGFGWHGV